MTQGSIFKLLLHFAPPLLAGNLFQQLYNMVDTRVVGSFVVFRQIYLYVMANFICNEIVPIAMAYPAGWLLCSLANAIYYYKTPLDRHVVVEPRRKGDPQ